MQIPSEAQVRRVVDDTHVGAGGALQRHVPEMEVVVLTPTPVLLPVPPKPLVLVDRPPPPPVLVESPAPTSMGSGERAPQCRAPAAATTEKAR
jgi:hypothetical protein